MPFVGALSTPYGPGLLAGAGPPLLPAVPPTRTMAGEAKGWIAHVYTNAWAPKATFSVPGQLPAIQASLNGGFQPITLAIGSLPATTVVDSGDLILISEQGGDGLPVYGGTVEDFPDTVDTATGQTAHGISVSPFVAELTDTGAALTYSTPTEVSQMIREALALTAHCQFTFATIPDTGLKFPAAGQNPIQFTGHVADVLNTALLMAGPTWCWFCDERGTVWFQPMGSTADYSVRRGADYNRRQGAPTAKNITNLKNYIPVIGGVPSGQSAPVVGIYTNPSSQATYGKRSWDPPPTFPAIADSFTLTAIAQTLGAMFDRRQLNVGITLPRFSQRVTLGQLGGPTVRFWEPSSDDPMPETDPGPGFFSNVLSVLDVTTDGPQQAISIADLPYNTTDDFSYLAQRISQRISTAPLVVPGPTLNSATVMQAGQQAGVGGGRLTVVDGNLVTRAQFGNLPFYQDPNGVQSPPEYGMRAMDASGNLLFDTIGVVGVMQLLGSVGLGGTFSSGATMGTVNFDVIRPVNVLVIATYAGWNSSAGNADVQLFMDGNDVGDTQQFGLTSATNASPIALVPVGAGRHSAIISLLFATNTFVISGSLYVFQLGA